MTKGVLVDLILLAVSGGKLSIDNNVWRDDIAAYLPAVVAEAVRQDAYQKRAESRADMAVTGILDFFTPVEFYKEVVATPVLDPVTKKYYVILPELLDLPAGWNVQSARPAGTFDADYIRLPGFQSFIGAQELGQPFFWVQKKGIEFRMYFSAMLEPVQAVAAMVAVSPSALEDGDELPIPAGLERWVIDTAVQHFRGQAGIPADSIYDDKGVNETPMMGKR